MNLSRQITIRLILAIDNYEMSKTRIKFNGSFLNRFPPTILHGDIVNIYIVYEITSDYSSINYPILQNFLLGSVKYGYFGYSIGFDRNTSFSVRREIGKNVIIFGTDMSPSTKIDNRKKDILILGIGSTQGLENMLSAEKMYSINFTKKNTTFCLSLHYNRANSYLFVNGTEIIKFKAKDSEILAYSLCLGNISKDWSLDNVKKTGFNGYIYDFSTDYNAIAVSDILDIHKYLMKKNGIV